MSVIIGSKCHRIDTLVTVVVNLVTDTVGEESIGVSSFPDLDDMTELCGRDGIIESSFMVTGRSMSFRELNWTCL